MRDFSSIHCHLLPKVKNILFGSHSHHPLLTIILEQLTLRDHTPRYQTQRKNTWKYFLEGQSHQNTKLWEDKRNTLANIVLILKTKNLQIDVKKSRFFFLLLYLLVIFIMRSSHRTYWLFFFSFFSFSYTEACTHHGIICICSNYHFFYEIVSCNVVLLCQNKWLVV